MDSYLRLPSVAALRMRSESSPVVSHTSIWSTPMFGTAALVAGSTTVGHVGSVAPMSANAGIDTRPAAKQNRPPREVLR